MKIASSCTIRDLVGQFPNTRSVFDRYGLKGCGGPEGPAESLGFFARAHGVELSTLVRELQDVVDRPGEILSSRRLTRRTRSTVASLKPALPLRSRQAPSGERFCSSPSG